MSEERRPEADLIWGISVPTVGGRRQWPEAIKASAVARIRAGEAVVAIASEIGANDSVIHRWLSQWRKRSAAPGFVEVTTQPLPEVGPDKRGPSGASQCTITLGDVSISIGPEYPIKDLQSLIRAVRGSL